MSPNSAVVPGPSLRIITLGAFTSGITALPQRLSALKTQSCRSITLAQLPDPLNRNDVLLTCQTWMNGLDASTRAELARRAGMAAHWVVITDADDRIEDQIGWQRAGVSQFFQQPLDPERLAALIEDLHDQLHGPALRVIVQGSDAHSLARHSAALQEAGIDVCATGDPLQMAAALRSFKPDLLLLDIALQHCSGPELTSIVRQHPDHARLPVIFLSGTDAMQQILLSQAASFENFLIGPAAPELLVVAVKSHAWRYRSMQRCEMLRRQQDAWANARLEQLRVAVDEHAIISIADVKGAITHVNDRFCVISGYSRNELMGQNHRMIKSVTHPPGFYRELWRTIGAGKTWHGEVCNQRNNGDLYWVDATIVPFLDDRGKPTQYISIRTDITTLKHSQEAQRLSEERFSFAVEGAGDGISDWNLVTGERTLSGHYEAMLGFDKGEIDPTAAAWIASIHPDDVNRMQQHLQDYLSGAAPDYDVQLRLRCKNGSYKWILCRNTLVTRDEVGNPLRMIGIHSNISERKEVEAALVEARVSAERANLAKSAFLSSMSHELRTPMNAILGFSQMLEYDSGLNADQQDNVHEILKGGRHLLELINEVLDLAKIESGRIDLSLEPVELAGLAEDCRQLILPLAATRHIKLMLDVPPYMAVRADHTRLKQVLLNLLSNAIKYNRDGGTVRVGVQMLEEGWRRITVADEGNGIAPADMAQLFQPFSRLNAKQNDIEGTGIGLTITRSLVELMGGKVGFDSQVGVGSTFWIDMPALAQTTLSLSAQCEIVDAQAPNDEREQKFRILCIDDNPVNLKLIAQMLRMRSTIELITAHAPELGIELALAHQPELILLDINMPAMDGYQVLGVLKSDVRLAAIPVIAVTANAMPRDIERGRAAGFVEYLTKPLDVSLFLKTIDHFMADTQLRAA
jgi:PAS domain S-box-containing protein